jgi:hypothetical protein
VNLICGSRTEREKAHRDTVRPDQDGEKGFSPGCSMCRRTGS